MEETYAQGQTFDRIDYKLTPLPKGEYEGCRFTGCDFSGADLSGVKFIDCVFAGCNLSLAKLTKTLLRDIRFKDCKMLGLQFYTCDAFGLALGFEGCVLDNASFYKARLKKTVFKNTRLREVDFTDADLTGAGFDDCDLKSAAFDNTILEKADFRTSHNYSIDGERNRIKKALFSWPGVAGLLSKYDIDISG